MFSGGSCGCIQKDNVCEKRVLFTPQFFDPVELQVLAAAIRGRLHLSWTSAPMSASIRCSSPELAGRESPRSGGRAAARNLSPARPSTWRPTIWERSGPCNAPSPTVTERWTCSSIGATGARAASPWSRGRRSAFPAGLWKACWNEAGFNRVDALKIDIEGAEDTVLVPFFATAPSRLWPSLILLETSSDRWKSDCVALCIEHGYKETHRTRLNVILERPRRKTSRGRWIRGRPYG